MPIDATQRPLKIPPQYQVKKLVLCNSLELWSRKIVFCWNKLPTSNKKAFHDLRRNKGAMPPWVTQLKSAILVTVFLDQVLRKIRKKQFFTSN